MRVIAVINQKGGVGKTTTVLNLAHALALSGRRVLALDLDPQGHLTAGFGLERAGRRGMDGVLLEQASLAALAVEAREGLRLAPAGERLGEVEFLTEGGARRGLLLQEAVAALGEPPDFVVIDSPPSTGLLAMNALMAASELLIPVSGDYLALHALSRFLGICRHIEEVLSRVTRKWIVLTRFQERRRLAREVRERVLKYFPSQVLVTPIRESVALAESPGFGMTIFEYQHASNGAEDYRALSQDLINERTL